MTRHALVTDVGICKLLSRSLDGLFILVKSDHDGAKCWVKSESVLATNSTKYKLRTVTYNPYKEVTSEISRDVSSN